MRASNVAKAAALALSVAFAAGCSTQGTTTDTGSAASDTGTVTTNTTTSQAVSPAPGLTSVKTQEQLQREALANLRTIFYFDFDKSTVRADGMADLEAHAQYLSANPNVNVRLDGHADERGTREYNMALGERRALAVSRFLQVNGVAPAQIETVSYGEEKPAVLGHDRAAWAENRRVVLKYEN